ncbi:MAG: right-handed parallel beta-helix repeat-containing protein [Casimicrobiaceae bacterium]
MTLRLLRTSSAIVLALGGLFTVAEVHGASAQRTFVATYGSDASPNCSPAAPCRSFGTAIVRTASGGEIIVLDSGGYGPLTITQSVSLIAPPGVYGGISVLPALDGIVVDGAGITVVLRGLTINGQGGNVGIKWLHGDRLFVDGCTIANLGQQGILGDSGGQLIVADSTIRANGGPGVEVAGGVTVIDRSRLENNQIGATLSQGGLSLTGSLTVSNSTVVGNGSTGIEVSAFVGQDYRLTVDQSVVRDHALAGVLVKSNSLSTFARGTVTRSTLAGNGDGIRSEVFEGNSIVMATGNSISSSVSNGILATGPGAYVEASANTLQQNASAGMRGAAGGTVATRSDNGIYGASPLAGTVVTATNY